MNVTYAECDQCGESIRVVFDEYAELEDDRELAYDVSSGELHTCWQQLPDDAQLLRLD